MMQEEKYMLGIAGTAVSAAGAGLSVNELQAIISIIVTVAGFVISVLVPLCIKLYGKIKKALEDGKVDSEELGEIADVAKDIIKESSEIIDEVSEKSEGEK